MAEGRLERICTARPWPITEEVSMEHAMATDSEGIEGCGLLDESNRSVGGRVQTSGLGVFPDRFG